MHLDRGRCLEAHALDILLKLVIDLTFLPASNGADLLALHDLDAEILAEDPPVAVGHFLKFLVLPSLVGTHVSVLVQNPTFFIDFSVVLIGTPASTASGRLRRFAATPRAVFMLSF